MVPVQTIIGYSLASIAGGYVTIHLGNAIGDMIGAFVAGVKDAPAAKAVNRQSEPQVVTQKVETLIGLDFGSASKDDRDKLIAMIRNKDPIGRILDFAKSKNVRFFK
jgi:hypothetical protein